MIHRVRNPLLALFMFWSMGVFSGDFDWPNIKMGPLLHFNGADANAHNWQVSALYPLPSLKSHPFLAFEDQGKKEISFPKLLGSKFGYDFVRYDMKITQGEHQLKIEYYLLGEEKAHTFFVPAIGHSSNILYHSCNGYQSEADRKSVGGITNMWSEINRRHQEKPFELQLGGGDQIYADGLIGTSDEGCEEPVTGKTYGVFALPSLQSWLKHKESLSDAPFTDLMKAEAERFYFDHYIRHYTTKEFKKTMASVPILAQPDDHDYYDGCGSYPAYLQNSPVMHGLRTIGGWYAFTVQHQVDVKEVPQDEKTKIQTHNFLHVIDDGKLAILGVDTRSERSENEVVSASSWDFIFSKLGTLGPQCKHLIVMLAVPVTYVSTKALEKAFAISESIGPLDATISMIPGVKNSFGLFELADDCRDGWCHKAHKQERNEMIIRFQKFAETKHVRVTFFSGDVHVGGAGKIYHKDFGIDDCSQGAIWQIISSPVGNITVGKAPTKIIGKIARHEKVINNDCAMCTFKLQKVHNQKKGHSLIRRRNFVTFALMPNNQLDIRWSAESKKNKAHKLYQLIIPSAELKIFGEYLAT